MNDFHLEAFTETQRTEFVKSYDEYEKKCKNE